MAITSQPFVRFTCFNFRLAALKFSLSFYRDSRWHLPLVTVPMPPPALFNNPVIVLSRFVDLNRLSAIKSHFLTWWPWPFTLTIELGWDMIKVHHHTKIRVRTSNGSARRPPNDRQPDTHTHTHTGPILLPRPLTREVMNLSSRAQSWSNPDRDCPCMWHRRSCQ